MKMKMRRFAKRVLNKLAGAQAASPEWLVALARPGPETELFTRASRIPGFTAPDDAQHFALILKQQALMGMRGDVIEIGTWFGRSAAILAAHLGEGERLVAIDAFQEQTQDRYSDRPTVSGFKAAIADVLPDLRLDRVVVIAGDSRSVELAGVGPFRFAHVDGGHSFDECLADLLLVADHMLPGGVIAVDDFDHADWPEVKPAVDEFISRRSDYILMTSLNRWNAKGRKAYLARLR